MYIRYNATIEDKPNGQKKIGGTRPAYSKITKQIEYAPGSGKYYSLLMGREIKKDQYVMLLDFDNKADANSKNGLELVQLLNLDQYKAPKANNTIRRATLSVLCGWRTSQTCRIQDRYHMRWG